MTARPLLELTNRRTRSISKGISFEAGRQYDIRLEYFENGNQYSSAKLNWAPPTAATKLKKEALATGRQANAVVMVMGITPSIEGEEMDVRVEGFRGGDRTEIALPKPQEELIREVQALGKPVVLVLLGGSALAVNWANDNVPAILDAWYPGQEGGTAIAEVLFGDYNPGGRLPVTFYKSVSQLPPFTDYSMQGRTYRYFKGDPLYPFGFGLSFTTFKYSDLKLSSSRVKAGDSVKVSLDVSNSGSQAGDEVVQLYITDVASSFPLPIRSLAGTKRMFLKQGEKQNVSFTITPQQMSVIDDNGKRLIEPGEFVISVGGKQPGFRGSADELGNAFSVILLYRDCTFLRLRLATSSTLFRPPFGLQVKSQLTCVDRNGQKVLSWWQWTGRVESESTRRVFRAIEVEHDLPVFW